MRNLLTAVFVAAVLGAAPIPALAAQAIKLLGKDFTFPNKIDGLPAKLSDFKDLQINHFTTNDGVKLGILGSG